MKIIFWFVALVAALAWERIVPDRSTMSYGRITAGDYLPWNEYVAEVNKLDRTNRQTWISYLYDRARKNG